MAKNKSFKNKVLIAVAILTAVVFGYSLNSPVSKDTETSSALNENTIVNPAEDTGANETPFSDPVEAPISIPTLNPQPSPEVEIPSANSSGDYACNCAKTCSQLSCAEAQYQLNTCGCSVRDRDNDGVACDAQCQ